MHKFKASDLTKALGSPIAVLVCLGAGLLVFLVLRVPGEQAQFYLFSAVAQGLAAILGIGVAASLVFISQLLSNYNPRVRLPMNRWTLAYFTAYFMGIILPLSALTRGRWDWMVGPPIGGGGFEFSWASLSLWWMIVTLAFLPVYLLYLRDRLSPDGWLNALERQGKALGRRVPIQQYRHWTTYATGGLNASMRKDFDTFERAFTALCAGLLEHRPHPDWLPQEEYHFHPQHVQHPWQAVLKSLDEISGEAPSGTAVTSRQIYGLAKMGNDALRLDPPSRFVASQAANQLLEVGLEAVRNHSDASVSRVLSELAGVAQEAVRKPETAEVVTRSVTGLDTITRVVATSWLLVQGRDELSRIGLERIGSIGFKAAEDAQCSAAVTCVAHLSALWHFMSLRGDLQRATQAAFSAGRVGVSAANQGCWTATKRAANCLSSHSSAQLQAGQSLDSSISISIKHLGDLGIGAVAHCSVHKCADDGVINHVSERLVRIFRVANTAPANGVAAQSALDALGHIGREAAKKGCWDGLRTVTDRLATVCHEQMDAAAGPTVPESTKSHVGAILVPSGISVWGPSNMVRTTAESKTVLLVIVFKLYWKPHDKRRSFRG